MKQQLSTVQQLSGTDIHLQARTGITRRNWQRMRMLGTGPPYRKVGRLCLYDFADVDQWLANHPLMKSTVEQVAA